MNNRKFAIVGGGTTGWLLALFLMRRFPKSHFPHVEVSLVEAPDIASIGVGEGSFPALNEAFATLGIRDEEWMPQCDATYKTGIDFANWGLEPNYFQAIRPIFHKHARSYFPRRGPRSAALDCPFVDSDPPRKLSEFLDFSNYYLREKAALLSGLSYHFDAGKLADCLRRISTALGLNHLSDTVVSVEKTTDGAIGKLNLREAGPLEADYFFDCSGFHGLLAERSLNVPFIEEKRSLLCDRALAARVPQPQRLKSQDKTHTTSTTATAGWMWQIPLSGRDGCGYVYSSDFISDEQAADELLAFIESAYGVVIAREGIKQLRFRTGQRKYSWYRNCVSFGLANNFVEPLEATAIGMTCASIAKFLATLGKMDEGGDLDNLRAQYNAWSTQYYNDVRDYIIAHYACAGRNDTAFWKANKHDILVPASLQRQLDDWINRRLLNKPGTVFRPFNWFSLFVGQSYF